MAIKIGAVAWGLPGGGYYAPKIAKSLGLDGIQLELGSYEWGFPLAQKAVMDGYLEDREKYGIEYPAIVLNDVMVNEFINGLDTEHGKIAVQQIGLAVDCAVYMGISDIMIPNFLDNLILTEAHIANTVAYLKYACNLALDKGITILTESGLDWPEQRKLMEDVNMPNLKIHFDTQNFKYNFDMAQCPILEHLYDLFAPQMHTKDGGEPGANLLGEGITDFYGQMKILAEKGYDGWIVIENYYNLAALRGKEDITDQTENLKKDIQTLKSCFGL